MSGESDTSVVVAIVTLFGVIATAGATVLVARIATRTHNQVKASNGTPTGQGVEQIGLGVAAIRAFQVAHDVDDERRFITLFRQAGLPTEEARSLARDALVVDRRVMEQQASDAVPFPESED
jgi:hypothetical protein